MTRLIVSILDEEGTSRTVLVEAKDLSPTAVAEAVVGDPEVRRLAFGVEPVVDHIAQATRPDGHLLLLSAHGPVVGKWQAIWRATVVVRPA